MDNILNNLAPFYVGQKVAGSNLVPVNSRIKRGEIYTIRVVHYSESGNPISPPGAKYWYVGINDWPEHNWLGPHLFVAIEESFFPSLTMSEVIEKECALVSMN